MIGDPWRLWTLGLRNAQMGAEMFDASRSVVEHRHEVMRDAARNPLAADYAELWLMGAEKVAAFAAAGAAAAQGWATLQQAWFRPMAGGRFGEAALRSSIRTMTPVHATVTANVRRLRKKPRT